MLSSLEITTLLQNAMMLMIDRSEQQKRIIEIQIIDDRCLCDWDDTPTPMESNIQKIARCILEHVDSLCSTTIPEDTLIAHINMLAPGFPLDLLGIFQDAITGTISDPNIILARLDIAKKREQQRHTPPMVEYWNVDFDTHIGKRKAILGQTNQDYFFIGEDGPNALFMVADGISISNAGSGNLASNIAAQVISHMWKEEKENLRTASPKKIEELLTNFLYNSNYNICESSKNLSQNGIENDVPMGTTILLAYAQGSFVTLLSLGDSRAYLLTDEGPTILTGDHNVRGERLRMGLRYEESNSGNALMRYLGYFNEHYEIALPKPEIFSFDILPEERLLLCSDGYTDYAAHRHADLSMLIRDAVEGHSLAKGCNNLILQANLGGGGDNITVLIAEAH